jgi:hypothetical protein
MSGCFILNFFVLAFGTAIKLSVKKYKKDKNFFPLRF